MLDILIILSMVLFSVFVAKVLVYISEQVGTSSTTRYKSYSKEYLQRTIQRINNNFGRETWKKFIKNDLKETQRAIKKTLSKKMFTQEDYYKLTELVDEMERYIKNNIEYSPTTELDDELELLRKINAQKSSSK